jgi:hypothetical protein
MIYAVEFDFDPAAEAAVGQIRATLTRIGIPPILDEIGERQHISLAVFRDIDRSATIPSPASPQRKASLIWRPSSPMPSARSIRHFTRC